VRLIILGAGGHGKVVADLAKQTGRYKEIFFLDDNSQEAEVIGKCSQYLEFQSADTEMYPAFGNNTVRIQWENKLLEAGISLAKIIHPLAYVSPLAEVASGCVIMPYAVVNTGTKIKKACIINIGAMVDHDCILEEGCHLAPGAIVKGENHLPEGMKVDSGEVVPLQYYN
jgi:sugar O-acyltransferase (sialic acid O-acetyltransferase NeuD family)